MPLISVVTPVFNAEKYLRQAIESIINQTFSDWEYILVNDGSTDKSLEIIKEYSKKDSRIRFESIFNSGSAKIPRDLAISKAKGEWIVALDADDYLSQDSLEKMVTRQRETNTKIVLQKTKILKGNEMHMIPNCEFDILQIFSGKEAVKLTIGSWQISASGMLVHRELLQEPLNPNRTIFMSSDELDTRRYFLRAESLSLADAEYVYRINAESITQKPSIKLFDTLIINEKVGDLLKENFDFSDPVFYTHEIAKFNYILNSRLLYLKYVDSFNNSEKKSIKKLIKSQYLKIARKSIRQNFPVTKRLLHLNFYSVFCLTTFIQSKFL